MLNKYFKILYIFFSKLYIKFSSSKKNDDWYYMPLLIISSLFGYNFFVLSSFFIKYNTKSLYIIIVLILLFFVFLSFLTKKDRQEVVEYQLSIKNKLVIILFLLVNLCLLIYSIRLIKENREIPIVQLYPPKAQVPRSYQYPDVADITPHK